MGQDTNDKALEQALDIYEVKIISDVVTNPTDKTIRLFGVEDYSVKDIGKQINRVQFANSASVYFQEQPYNTYFKDITFKGFCWKENFDNLLAIFSYGFESNDKRIVKVVDIYGHTYDYALINDLQWERAEFNAVEAVHFSINIIVINGKDSIFRVGGTVSSPTYGIESCAISLIKGEPDTLKSWLGFVMVVPKAIQNDLYEVKISGIELIDSSTKLGKFTSTLTGATISFTPPGLNAMSVLVRDVETNLIVGVSGFQNFSVSLIGVYSLDNILSSGTLLLNWSEDDQSARFSVFDVVGAVVIQKFANVYKKVYTIDLITSTPSAYAVGTIQTLNLTVLGGGVTGGSDVKVKGLIQSFNRTPVEGSGSLYTVNLNLLALEAA